MSKMAIYVELAQEMDPLITIADVEVKFWMGFRKRHRNEPEFKGAANRFIAQAIDEKIEWLRLKEKYLSIGLRLSQSAPQLEQEDGQSFLLA